MRPLTLGLLLTAASAFAANDTAVHLPLQYNTFVPPAVGQSYTDTSFGVAIKRVSNARQMTNNAVPGPLTFVSTEYPTAAPFNSDNTRLILQHQGYFGLYDGAGTYLRDLAFTANASTEPRWSRTDPNALYYVSGNSLMKLNVSSGASTLVHAFTEYAAIRGRGESEISRDGDHFVFSADEPSSPSAPGLANRFVFVYEISTNTKGAVLDTIGHEFNNLYLAPDNGVAIGWLASGTSRFNGVEFFDRNMAFQRQVTHAIGHMHLTRDLNGDDVLIWNNSDDGLPIANCQNGIVKVRLADGHQTCLLQLDWSLAVHITAPDGNGWAFVETYDPTDPPASPPAWKTYTNEILQVKLDGTEVRRLLHHRSRQTANYAFQPRATVSRDGSRIVFTSNFDLQAILGYPSTYTDAYFVTVPAMVPPRLTINDASVIEGNSGTRTLTFTVQLSWASDLTITVPYKTTDGSAVAPSDYASNAGTLVFAPGETAKTIVVTVNGDTTIETNETFFVDLLSATNSVIDVARGSGEILSDEGPPTVVTGVATQVGQTGVTLNGTVAAGGQATTAVFEYGLTTSYGSQKTITPPPGSGYADVGVSATLTGLACSTKHHYRLVATSAAGTTIGADGTFTTTLCDGLSIDDPVIAEGGQGKSIIAFTLSVSPPSTNDVTVNYTTGNGSAAAGSDYTAASGVFTIPAGSPSKRLAIVVQGDTNVEPDETLTVTLSGAVGVVVGKSVGTGTILNDDPASDATTVAQYRLYHDGTKEHLYTTDLNEYTVLGTRGWTQEGVAYRMLTNGLYLGVSTVPLFRLYHPGIQQHHWTTDSNEATTLSKQPGWFYESTIGYLLPTQVDGTVPLFRLALATPPLHLWTTDRNEYETLVSRGWTFEGIIGYVIP